MDSFFVIGVDPKTIMSHNEEAEFGGPLLWR
jgi:hypothetical protein